MEFVQVQKSWVILQNCTHPGKDEGGVFAVSTPHSQLAWGHCTTGFLAVDIESVLWSHGSYVGVWDVCVGGVWVGMCGVGYVWGVCVV